MRRTPSRRRTRCSDTGGPGARQLPRRRELANVAVSGGGLWADRTISNGAGLAIRLGVVRARRPLEHAIGLLRAAAIQNAVAGCAGARCHVVLEQRCTVVGCPEFAVVRLKGATRRGESAKVDGSAALGFVASRGDISADGDVAQVHVPGAVDATTQVRRDVAR